jgi:NAD(P)H dehydrogenase (quinone)
MESFLYAITGITGKVGGVVAHTLLDAKLPVRAIVRDAKKGKAWDAQGCEVVLADIIDPAALAAAFDGAEGVFVLIPPMFDPTPGFPEARSVSASLKSALETARPQKVVCLSTIGAQAVQPNLLNQLGIMEQTLGTLPTPVAFLRAAWFMENFAWDVAPAREKGVIPSFLQPLDKPVPMVATADIGLVAARLLRETWSGRRLIELEGPRRITPNEVAVTFSRILRKAVRIEIVPRETWKGLFTSQGMKNPTPRIQMLDGFNQGWIEFEGGKAGSEKGSIELVTVLHNLVENNDLR